MVDFNKKIFNSNKFRQSAIHFQTHGIYTSAPRGTTEYIDFWEREMDRCIHGYTADDGDFITGYHYFYLNYCPIVRIVNTVKKDNFGNETIVRRSEREFPDFYDYDYYYFNAIEEATNEGKHLIVAKSRRKGYSYKGGAMLCRNFYLIPESKSYVCASDKKYLTGDGILTKAWAYMDFIDENTAWGKKRQVVNTMMHRRASFQTTDAFGNKTESGYRSEIIGITLRDNPDAVRGIRGILILFEEAGMFPELAAAWQIVRPSVEQDGVAFGLIIGFGCVCKGSRVFTKNGDCKNIEDLKKKDGVLGWDTYQVAKQNILNINPPDKKECVRITFRSGRTIECSKDHPLIWSKPGKTRRVPGKREENEHMKSWLWHEAGLCKIGEQVGIIDEMPIFGKRKMWEPRLVGWLIGDGSYGFDKTPRLSNCDQDILKTVHDNFDTVVEKEYVTKQNKIYHEIRIKGICPKLRELGIYGQTKSSKRLPNNVHQFDMQSLQELIGGIYDTDGYIAVSKNKNDCKIVLTQSHKEILLEIQELLLKFGIHGIVRFIKPSNRNRVIKDISGEWRLEIRDIISLSKFVERIPLTIGYKNAALDLIGLFSETHRAKYNNYLVGLRADKITNIEDIGLQDIYNITASENHNYIVNGVVTHNTGGSDSKDLNALRTAFYDPKSYNCLGFPNIWDTSTDGKECGFFVPQWTNMDIRDDHGKRLYMDDDGNTLIGISLKFIQSQREEELASATDSRTVDRYIAERAINPAEAFMSLSGNIFPKKELQEHLSRIRTNKKLSNHKQVGDLVWSNGVIEWRQKKTGDINKYPLAKDDDASGSIVIWEHPVKDAPYGLYLASCDSYDHDISGTNSLGSTFIYKRFQNFEEYYDMPVAEYTGRPSSAEEFYENTRKLVMYYNAKLLYENQNKGLFTYFSNKHCDYLLMDQPDILSDIVSNSKVQRKKGVHITQQIRDARDGWLKDWLNEETSPGCRQLEKILSEPLLEELIMYNREGNFDRVDSFGLIMIALQQLHNTHVKNSERSERKRRVFDIPLFSQQWYNQDDRSSNIWDNILESSDNISKIPLIL